MKRGPAVSERGRRPSESNGFTLRELIVVLVVLSLAAVLLIPCVLVLGQHTGGGKITDCASNLSQMTKAMYNYSITKGEPEGAFPAAPFGDEWWKLLYTNDEIDDHKVLWCPVLAESTVIGTVDYWGPAADPNTLGAGDAIGCDRPGNHGDDPDVPLNWVAKSGDVHKLPASSPKWASIRRTVKP